MLKLEECTKEDLIWYLRHRCFYDAKNFEFDVLMHRTEENQKAASAAFEKSNDALGRYVKLIKPYEGKPVAAVPDDIIHKAATEMKTRESAIKRYKLLEKQYKALQRRIDKLLDDEENKNAE